MAWRAALDRFAEDLRRRGVAEKTRRAYAADLRQFAAWATERGTDPVQVTPRLLRRYAAALSSGAAGAAQRGAAPTTVARKLASLRAFFRTLREHGDLPANPADLLAAPKRAQKLPRVLKRRRGRRAAGPHPRHHAPGAARPRAVRARLRVRPARRGARDLDVGSVDFDAEEVRVEGKGSKTRFVPAGEPALRALERYGERARAALADGDGEAALFLSKSGRRLSTSDVRRRLRVWTRHAAVPGGVPSARAAPFVRHAPARGGRRPARDPGAAGARLHLNDSGLHSGRVGAPEDRVCASHIRGRERVELDTNVKAIELKDLWRRYKARR